MYKIPLLPKGFKKPGFILIAMAIALYLLGRIHGFHLPAFNFPVLSLFNEVNDPDHGFAAIINHNIHDELISLFLIAGGIFIGFSKQPDENEFTMSIRMSSLTWAVMVWSIILFAGVLFLYDFAFLQLMMYNVCTILFVHVVRFYFLIYKSTKAMQHGE